MIPKIIHYCWFGKNPLSPMALKCIESWRKYLPEYEIKEWNEDNFDVNIIPYTSEAYNLKKYAFVSDYARFWILYRFGGLYFDTDVEIIKDMDEIISKGPFIGCENPAKEGESPNELGVAAGLGIGAPRGFGLYKDILDVYDKSHYVDANGNIIEHTVVTVITDLLIKKGLLNTSEIQCIDGLFVYPKDYFCPKDYLTGKVMLSANTVSIHHYDATWQSEEVRWKLKFVSERLQFLHPILRTHISIILAAIKFRKCEGALEIAKQYIGILRRKVL